MRASHIRGSPFPPLLRRHAQLRRRLASRLPRRKLNSDALPLSRLLKKKEPSKARARPANAVRNSKAFPKTTFHNHTMDYFIWANKKGIIDRTVELSMPEGAYLDEDTATLEMPSPGRLKFKEKNAIDGLPFDSSRSPRAVTGTRSALVVKVIASGAAAEFSEARLSNSVFGNGADGNVDPVTMKSHFQTCSNGQLNFLPAIDRDGTSIRIRNGKYEHFFIVRHIFLYHSFSHRSHSLPAPRISASTTHTHHQEQQL